MRRVRDNLRTPMPDGTRGAPAPELDKQMAGFYTKFVHAASFACIVGAVVGFVAHVVLALVLTMPVFLVLGPVALLSVRTDDRLERPPGDSVAYWAVFARAHKTTDLPARALVYEVALRSGVLAWLEGRTTPAQREVAFALAPEFTGTIGELLDVARHLEAEDVLAVGARPPVVPDEHC